MNYRKLWTQNFGPIPFDENGVRYEIHHIDGNRSHDVLTNFACISIKEHFQIHHDQGDWAAAARILQKIKNIELLKEIGFTPSTFAQYMAKNNLGVYSKESKEKSIQTRRKLQTGYCHNKNDMSAGGKKGGPIGGKLAVATHKRNGTGIYSKDHQSKAGKAGGRIVGKMQKGISKPLVICPHCGKTGGGQALMNRWHFGNCSQKKDSKLAPSEISSFVPCTSELNLPSQ